MRFDKLLSFILFFFMIQADLIYALKKDQLVEQYEPRNFRVLVESNDTVLKVIGSGQFSQLWLEKQKKTLPKPLVVVDLRQEPHGFINGMPYTWYTGKNIENVGLPEHLIEVKEKFLLKKLAKKNKKYKILSERDIVEASGLAYLRFPIQDHYPPSPAQISKWVKLIKSRYNNAWLYLHCRAGKGRTTFFMTIMDILENKSKDSFNEILQRQADIGGKDYLHFYPTRSYKYPLIVWKYHMLKNFYDSI